MNEGLRHAWAGLTERVITAVTARPIRLPRPSLPAGVRRGLTLAQPYLRGALRAVALLIGLIAAVILGLVVAYRWINPPLSALMLGQSIAGTEIERTWVPLDRVSPHLIRAVIVSEDGRFCTHGGVDWPALKEAIANDRGGSTITMQVVKNLFLWPSRSYVRKFIELALAYVVEAVWPKRRILEIYLNIAEWGDGIFGVEAAARMHFGKTAARLTEEEAALLAVALPSPLERTPGQPSAGTIRLAERLQRRMGATRAELACVRPATWASSSRPPGGPGIRPAAGGKPPVAGPKHTPKEGQKADWDYLFSSEN